VKAAVSAVLVAMIHLAATDSPTLGSTQGMSVATQNTLVQKYCVTCHTDAMRTGGLSLEHFDAAHVAPSLAAMMLSKMRSGAMGASNIKLPDQPTVDALAAALSVEAAGANNWSVVTENAVTTASVLREIPSRSKPGGRSLYRLVMTCAAGKGEMQLAWSPIPVKTTLTVMLGTKASSYNVDGADFRGLPLLVSNRVTFSGLFPGESVEFSFDGLAKSARRALAPCFKD